MPRWVRFSKTLAMRSTFVTRSASTRRRTVTIRASLGRVSQTVNVNVNVKVNVLLYGMVLATTGPSCSVSRNSRCSMGLKRESTLPQSTDLLLRQTTQCLRCKPCCCGTCSSPRTRRCCGGTLRPIGNTTCWSALANPRREKHHRWRQTAPRTQLVPRHEP